MSSRLKPEVHFYLVSDSYSKAQTRESVESAKKGLEYESFEYESRLDTPLLVCITKGRAKKKKKSGTRNPPDGSTMYIFTIVLFSPWLPKAAKKKINIHL